MVIELVIRHGVIIVFLIMIALVALARLSHSAPELGLHDGKLRACPGSPNCVCSENDPTLAIPLKGKNALQVWQSLVTEILRQGGRLVEENGHYLHAEYTTRLMGFVDDLEARLDHQQDMIHLRSASRVGYSDMGLNRRRVTQLLKRLNVI